jgi:ABC-type glutathione transport system ATPase component
MRDLAVDAGAAMLFISHDLSVLRPNAYRPVVMYRGRVVGSGRTDQVWHHAGHLVPGGVMPATAVAGQRLRRARAVAREFAFSIAWIRSSFFIFSGRSTPTRRATPTRCSLLALTSTP